jgi:general secretion pathway protein L
LFGKTFVVHPSHRKLRRIRILAAAAAAMALILLLSAVQWRQLLATREIDKALALTGKRAAAVRAKLTELEVFGKQAAEIQRRKFETVPIAGIWAELTKLMPDTAWLSELRIENSQVVISGFAKSSAELLGVLEASPLFEQASFTSPVSMARDSSVEQFSIRVKIEHQSTRGQRVSSVRQP